MNNKLGQGISEAERTKIEETEDIQIFKDIKIVAIEIKDRIIIKTTKIAADILIISIEEAIEGEITHPEKTLTNKNEIDEVILLEGENLMYIPLKFENKLRRRALIDTGACANAMSADFYTKLKEESPNNISELQQTSSLNVKVASGRTVKVLAQVDVKFKVNDHNFQESFLIFPSMNSVFLGNPLFKKNNIEIIPGENLLKMPEMTYQLNEIRIPKEGRRKIPKSRYPVFMFQKTTFKPQNQEIFYTQIEFSKILEGHTGMIIQLEEYENSTELKLSSSVVTVRKDNMLSILALNLNDLSKTFPKNKQVAVSQFLSPQEEEKLKETDRNC